MLQGEATGQGAPAAAVGIFTEARKGENMPEEDNEEKDQPPRFSNSRGSSSTYSGSTKLNSGLLR